MANHAAFFMGQYTAAFRAHTHHGFVFFDKIRIGDVIQYLCNCVRAGKHLLSILPCTMRASNTDQLLNDGINFYS